MSVKSSFTHSAPVARDQIKKRPSKVWTIRALEQERLRPAPMPVAAPEKPPAVTVDQKVSPRTFWKRLARGASGGKN